MVAPSVRVLINSTWWQKRNIGRMLLKHQNTIFYSLVFAAWLVRRNIWWSKFLNWTGLWKRCCMATKELPAPAYGLLILQVARLRGFFTWMLAQLLWLLQLWVRWLAFLSQAWRWLIKPRELLCRWTAWSTCLTLLRHTDQPRKQGHLFPGCTFLRRLRFLDLWERGPKDWPGSCAFYLTTKPLRT